MKHFTLLASCFSALLPSASAHYMFQYFTYGGVLGTQYQYIRPNTNNNSPVILLNSTDLRCNQGGISGVGTATITVQAGHAFSFTADIPVYHAGPLSMYMAKAPAAAADFDGSGQVWFKILDLGPTFDANNVATWPLFQTYNYTIPPALPNGDYLLRIQQLGIHNPYPGGIPQFYIECAQITVTGGGSGTPGPLVSIPGFIDGTEPGYVVNIYNQFYNYTVPGPAVWAGQSAGGGVVSTSSTKASSLSTTLKTSTSSVKSSSSSSSVKTTSSTSTVKTTSSSSSVKSTVATSSTKASTSSSSTKASTVSSSTKVSSTTTAVTATGTCVGVALYGQCAGTTIVGCHVCTAGTCTYVNDFYSQCV